MEKNSAASLLTSVDSLFTTQEERDIANRPRVQEIPVDKIDDFPNHPFKIRIPSFMKDSRSAAPSYTLTPDGTGKYSITLTDTNNILSQYSFSNTSELTFSVSGNKLTVTANTPVSNVIVAPTKQVASSQCQGLLPPGYRCQHRADPAHHAACLRRSLRRPAADLLQKNGGNVMNRICYCARDSPWLFCCPNTN